MLLCGHACYPPIVQLLFDHHCSIPTDLSVFLESLSQLLVNTYSCQSSSSFAHMSGMISGWEEKESKSPKCNAKTTMNPSARISFTHLWMPIARKRIQLDVRIRFPPPQWRRDNVNDRMSKCSAPLQLCHTSADYWEWVAYDLLYLNNIWQPFPITE